MMLVEKRETGRMKKALCDLTFEEWAGYRRSFDLEAG
jgi:hypothetical protein